MSTDRFDYGHELAESWKRQTLINVVRLRYVDAPVFMDITSIISSRSRGGRIDAGLELLESPDPSSIGVGAEGTWSNTPTVTYQPILGDKFTKSLLRPVPPAAVFRMLESGWPVHMVLNVTVGSMNGIKNAAFAGQTADPRFGELTDILARVRAAGALDIRVEERPNGEAVVLLIRGDSSHEARADIARARDILRLDAGSSELSVVFGSVQSHGKEIAMTTRSMLEIMLVLGNGIAVPEAHVSQGRARPVAADLRPLIRIQSGPSAPVDTYAAAPYRGHWYWIEDTDLGSKALFSFLMILFSIAETGQTQDGPVVTVPTR
ncbi:MAG: hypothetical protein A3H91_03605 [Gammaproteobacteria bacterium RIFCSPLOWO2_02_FULL_61_13]|nr:MAG: hypothetical protein A3H91_03605 [Gammaproteobacteria bacterium RIFCSPLOWO2_02_FULL_61_13]